MSELDEDDFTEFTKDVLSNKTSYEQFYKFMSSKVSLKEQKVIQSVLNHQLANTKMKTHQPYEMNQIKTDITNFLTNFESD